MTASSVLEPVPEDLASIEVLQPLLAAADVSLPAYAAVPRDASPQTPGVVLILHIWGVDEPIRDTVRRFASAGFAAVAPELFHRSDPPDGDGQNDYTVFRPHAEKLKAPVVDADVRAAAQWLKTRHPHGKIAVAGFCMGGFIALRQTIDNAGVFNACASWYGRVAGLEPQKIAVPVIGSYGESDTGIPVAEVRDFFDRIAAPADLAIYPGAGHAFFDRTRPSYEPKAAQDSWRRALDFLTKYLRA
ncbi:MAG TPA: dienelactone hydrolase family protein [Candidatus Baltobacteraceae bacterium]|nr:dienelactone hydrolase family protein [Candidatus Baltobacteraceae bacterium]